MALTANLNRDEKKRPELFTAVDFMHFMLEEPERILTSEEKERILDRIFS